MVHTVFSQYRLFYNLLLMKQESRHNLNKFFLCYLWIEFLVAMEGLYLPVHHQKFYLIYHIEQFLLLNQYVSFLVWNKTNRPDVTFVCAFFLFHFDHILFPTELHLQNVYYLYSACSNPTDNETAKFYLCVITQTITKTITKTITQKTSVGFEHAL